MNIYLVGSIEPLNMPMNEWINEWINELNEWINEYISGWLYRTPEYADEPWICKRSLASKYIYL